jgi:hypothetical protein
LVSSLSLLLFFNLLLTPQRGCHHSDVEAFKSTTAVRRHTDVWLQA